jgi:mono/diheme cytochrome c family protein
MMRHYGLLTLMFGVFVILTVRTAAETRQIRERDPEWVAPPRAATKANPLLNRPEATAGGRKLFLQRCSTCHGEKGRGTDKAPDLTAPDAQAQGDGALFWKISGGNTRAGMPAFSFLPEPQRWQLILHLRALAQERTSSSRDMPDFPRQICITTAAMAIVQRLGSPVEVVEAITGPFRLT